MSDSNHRFKAEVDESAEREAAAMNWMEEELGQPQATSRIDHERELARTAMELGLRAPRQYRYPRATAIKSWLRTLAAFKGGRAPNIRLKLWFDTPADRERRLAQRAAFGRVIRKEVARGLAGRFIAA